jgi:Animal haem peroxidase
LSRAVGLLAAAAVVPAWGHAGALYRRVAPANYADGVSRMVAGPSPRRVSNRVFADLGQNVFSENGLSQWVWTWGQFVDHDVELVDERPGESAPIPFDRADPLESFRDDLGAMDFARTPAAPGTGVTTPRQQVNLQTSYIDASQVYGTSAARLRWLRHGARLLLPRGYLPRAGAKPHAPRMDSFGPEPGRVAGDVRANENIALTGTQTLFAREHNRIVARLPRRLSADARFRIARRVVAAEIQFITYREFLPALGVRLPRYRGYRPGVDPAISDEFATVGYRMHSMVHGEFEPIVGGHKLVVPLAMSFGNADLLQRVGLGPLLASLAAESQYRNDEQIDNSLRSVLFELPKPGVTDPNACGTPVIDADCYTEVSDLGATDIARGRDHGMPFYDALRRAYGLPPKRSFAAITGERSETLPAGAIDDPHSLDFVKLTDPAGRPVALGADGAVRAVRRTTLAGRLRALYGSVDRLDAFVGMLAERHLPGSDLGELQQRILRRQFTALRDGDPRFYAHDRVLRAIARRYGVTYRHTLAQVVRMNTGAAVPGEALRAAG